MKYVCSKCNKKKQENSFPHAKGRRHSWCRDCNNEAKRLARAKFRETTPRKKRITADYITKEGKCICSHCNKAYPPEHYQRGGGGWCRKCRAENEANRRLDKGMKKRLFAKVTSTKKECMECHKMKLFSQFNKSSRGTCGVGSYCKPCQSKIHKDRYYDKEKFRENTKRYRAENRERHLAQHRVVQFNRKSKISATTDGTVTDDFLKTLYGTKCCYYCEKAVPKKDRTADHKKPLARGGKHTAKNLVMACRSCNSSKRDKTEKEFNRSR